ncbi:hypothetical protein FB45DRAFT_1126424 [Roridomyces roridus]|uniref:Uncharacterized protein n=1 Tax=Roridomyces roridus TaxID=1738132 RepID=A0AAD7C9I7_9AGAR|nr:hypothetical protein FB45DRAFT_1126424 [Roridomyces roridus]
MPPTLPPQKQSFVLTCGSPIRACIDATYPYPRTSPGKPTPSFLPTSTPSHALSSTKSDEARPSNGCGATIHFSGTLESCGGLWRGEGGAIGSTVVLLPAEYFTDRQKSWIEGVPRLDICGCMTVGVGCCICGNVLGSFTLLCEEHIESNAGDPTFYNFLPEAVSPPLPQPPGPAQLIRSSSFRWAHTLSSSSQPAPAPIRRVSSPTPEEIEASNREWEAMHDDIVAEYEAKLALQKAAAERFYAAEGVPRTDKELRVWIRRAVGKARKGGFDR